MLYHFSGNSHYLVSIQVKAWKDKFIEKYGDFNLINIQDLSDVDNNFLTEHMCSMSFLAEKKLIIISLNLGTKDSKYNEKLDLILTLLEKIPENNIVLFHSVSADKRSKYYKSINKIAGLKEFNSLGKDDTFAILKNKYIGKIQDNALQKLILYKSNNIDKISSEIEKLLITSEYIEIQDIEKNIYPELEESIFQFIDSILDENIIRAKNILNIILNDTSIYAFYNNLLANLRTNIYIAELKNKKKTQSEITQLLKLGNRGFLVNKNYRISYKQLKTLYINLIQLDKKMKSGKLIGTEEKDFQLEFENILLQLKKN